MLSGKETNDENLSLKTVTWYLDFSGNGKLVSEKWVVEVERNVCMLKDDSEDGKL